MAKDLIWPAVSPDQRSKILEVRWQRLCDLYLPRAPGNSIWRYAKRKGHRLPSSGWKLHISATILNAGTVLKRIAPFLISRGIYFKAPKSLREVCKLNSGLKYSYSQIGKIITVYPQNDAEAVFLARTLHVLTRRLAGPCVPFDLRFSDSSNVYYRFGAFEHRKLDRDGQGASAVYSPNGDLVPDIREQPKPDWSQDPFEAQRRTSRPSKQTPPSSIRVVRVLAQRGKGGVYVAVDFSSGSPRLCLLKEGRKHGEVSWDGRDGAWRVRNERRVLSHLRLRGVPVPHVQSSFELGGNFYLVMDYLDGKTLHEKLLSRRRRFTIAETVNWGLQLSEFIRQMHKAGWTWRDCKPKNIIITRDGKLVPIDFEGAAPVRRPDPLRWGTPGFTAPESHRRQRPVNEVADDLYALGSILFLLLTGRIYDPEEPLAITKLRRNVPSSLVQMVELLLAKDQESRLTCDGVRLGLNAILLNSKHPLKKLVA